MASLLAGSVTYLAYKRLRASSAQRKLINIVAAAKDLSAGITMTDKDVSLVEWPAELPLPGSITKTETVIGRALVYSLKAKEPILERDLAVPGAGIGLSAKIPPGMRATAVRSNEVVGVGGFIYPGSHVDVLATYNVPSGGGPLTKTLLQDVEVLAAGPAIEPDPQGKPQTVNVVTLLLSPEDSQKLLLTSGQGTIQFVLRSGADKAKAEINPTRLDQLLGLGQPSAAAPVARRTASASARRLQPQPAPPPPTRNAYEVEVIQGTERMVQKFPE